MDTTDLVIQAWLLYYKLSQKAYGYGIYNLSDAQIDKRRKRLFSVSNRAFERYIRRENLIIN